MCGPGPLKADMEKSGLGRAPLESAGVSRRVEEDGTSLRVGIGVVPVVVVVVEGSVVLPGTSREVRLCRGPPKVLLLTARSWGRSGRGEATTGKRPAPLTSALLSRR